MLNFIKYCLGYVKLTRQRGFLAQQKYAVNLPQEYLGLQGLLNGGTDDSLGELINLETFYSYDPKKVPENKRGKYEQEKELANEIEEIYNKYRNDQFTKQIIFSFGYFEIEIPIEVEAEEVSIEAEESEETAAPRTRIDRFPLFSIPVKIEKEFERGVGKYLLYFIDQEVQVNIGLLEPVLGEDLYYQLVDELGRYEIDGKLTLPLIEPDVFVEIWHKIKAQLKLREANFDEESFSLYEMRIALSPRANYFLAEDLQKLSKLTEEELEGTALTSWVEDEELNVESETPQEKDLYFPFLYDKYQLRVLSIFNNKAAIVQGPPGTGKSETISNLLCHLAATGNRVLFVSQKAQALKVVKDKLKKLGVKYLFGYIPNPASAQIGEEDEIDGIAPQLTALNSHIEKLGYKFHGRRKLIEYREESGGNPTSSIAAAAEEKWKLQGFLSASVETQRKYYQLHEELKRLKEYDITVTDTDCFEKYFALSEWQAIKELQATIEKLSKEIRRYEKTEGKKRFDQLFSTLDLKDKSYPEIIATVKEDVAKTGYDGHSKLLRSINNTFRKFRLSDARSKIPREIRDFVDNTLNTDISRNEAEKILEAIYNHCNFYKSIQKLAEAKDDLQTRLSTCGVSENEFGIIDDLASGVQSTELEEIKRNILRVQEIRKELRKLEKARDPNRISVELKAVERNRSERVALYIQNIVNKNIVEKWK